jgi:hypothetical protein
MMTPEQRYQLDTFGFLHLRGALSSGELSAAQAAAGRYIQTACHAPEPFGQGGNSATPWCGDDPRTCAPLPIYGAQARDALPLPPPPCTCSRSVRIVLQAAFPMASPSTRRSSIWRSTQPSCPSCWS